jgi:molybdopterin converting factor subunit 1
MIRVLFFGAAADRAGTRETELPVEGGATLAEVWPLLAERHPDLAPMRDTLAVNGEYARADDGVSPGDELAVLPPVSGG